MKKLYQVARRGFCSNYHHDFVPREELKKEKHKALVSLIDYGRNILYGALLVSVGLSIPKMIYFRSGKFYNNPDYKMFDEMSFKARGI